MVVQHKRNELGFGARRKGRFLEMVVNVTLPTTEILKQIKAVFEVEKFRYEARVKPQGEDQGGRD